MARHPGDPVKRNHEDHEENHEVHEANLFGEKSFVFFVVIFVFFVVSCYCVSFSIATVYARRPACGS